MPESIKKGDFVEIDYIGRLTSTGKIFDLTSQELAKKEGIFQENQKYGPVSAVVGEEHVLKGIDQSLPGKQVRQTYSIDLTPENAFGKRDSKLVQLASMSKFKDSKVRPYPGAQFAFDNKIATVRSVSAGRVMLDFNHPLAGKTLSYTVTVNRIITDLKEKIQALVKILFHKKSKVEISDKKITITPEEKIQALDLKPLQEQTKKLTKKYIPEIKDKEIEFKS